MYSFSFPIEYDPNKNNGCFFVSLRAASTIDPTASIDSLWGGNWYFGLAYVVSRYKISRFFSPVVIRCSTSLRDGMNLVSYEYIACQLGASKGVLVLSEFAGAAQVT